MIEPLAEGKWFSKKKKKGAREERDILEVITDSIIFPLSHGIFDSKISSEIASCNT